MKWVRGGVEWGWSSSRKKEGVQTLKWGCFLPSALRRQQSSGGDRLGIRGLEPQNEGTLRAWGCANTGCAIRKPVSGRETPCGSPEDTKRGRRLWSQLMPGQPLTGLG